jgi:MYXO-CTERM domain-containing protein
MRRLALTLCLLTFAGAAPATAQEQVAPPGNAGVDEYLETIPEADGNRPVRPPAESGGQGGLDADTQRELESLGDDGEAAARLADRAARQSGGTGSSDKAPVRDGETGASADSLDGTSGAGLGTVLGQTVSAEDGGLGVGLPILLAVTLLGAVAIVVVRRRRSRP